MQVESIHHLVACAYIVMWVLIGHLTIRRRTPSESETIRQRLG